MFRRAEWIYWAGWRVNHDRRISDAKCSKCGFKHPTVRREFDNEKRRYSDVFIPELLYNYCPNCGRKMRKY